MRRIVKAICPNVLAQNGDRWLREYLEDPTSETRKYRYRHPEIKQRLREETNAKCVYCESKIGHNTPGDTEHIKPISRASREIFVWQNLTIACTECNRRKSDYYDVNCMLLNPYTDDVEQMLVHLGPFVTWKPGNGRAEVTIRKLELDGNTRIDLISRKIEKIEEVKNLLERIEGLVGGALRGILVLKLDELTSVGAEFSGMATAVVAALRGR